MTKEQRVWFNVEPLTTDGLWNHYMNHGADKNVETIEDLEFLDFLSVANQLREFNQIYFPDEGSDARQEEFDKFSEAQIERDIEEMNVKFWKIYDELQRVLLKHILSSTNKCNFFRGDKD